MCGYSGLILSPAKDHIPRPHLIPSFLRSAEKISHRGDQPLRTAFHNSLMLAHARLAFQDISDASSQPLYNAEKSLAIVFNGEIYNYKELRAFLAKKYGHVFRTHGDTEVILAGFMHLGRNVLEHLEGEYSFVICRTDGSSLFAARDPAGVKPLFFYLEDIDTSLFAIARPHYSFQCSSLTFASEIKGIAQKKTWDKEGFLRQFAGLFEPIRTPYAHIIQVPPGGTLDAYIKGESNHFSVTLQTSHKPVRYPKGSLSPFIEQDFITAFRTSVQNRTVSDVELGVYLSGGIDSKVVAFELSRLMAEGKSSQGKVKSFTLSFEHAGYDESDEALAFAKAMNLSPHLLRLSHKHLAYSYPIAVYHSENVQPYTNGAAKWWLSRFARQHVQGVLTGDGADELLCGYPSFRYAKWWAFAMRGRNPSLTSPLEALLSHPLSTRWRDAVYAKKFLSYRENPWLSGSSAEGTGSDFVESLSLWGIGHPLFSQISATIDALLGPLEGQKWLQAQGESVASWFGHGFGEVGQDPEFLTNPENTMLLWQNYFCKTHLPVQVLNWVGDRMEMANTLEGRTPFLSKEMQQLVAKLPDHLLVRGFEEKSLLRRSYSPLIGPRFIKTPKKQFGSPFLYDPQALLESVPRKMQNAGLIENDKPVQELLQRACRDDFGNLPSHTHMHLQAAIQTLHCFEVLEETLISERLPNRDLPLEERLLTN